MKKIPSEQLMALCTGFDGDSSVYASIPATGEVFAYNEDKQYHAASTINCRCWRRFLKERRTARPTLIRRRLSGKRTITAAPAFSRALTVTLR